MKIFQRAIFGLAALAVSVVAVPADADTTVSTPGATVRFYPYIQRLVVTDTAADGDSAVAQYYWGNVKPSDPPELWAQTGVGTSAEKNFDKPEGAKIHFRACRGNWGTKKVFPLSCSTWVTKSVAAYAPDDEPIASR